MRSRVALPWAILFGSLVTLACSGDELTAPVTGTITVTISTTGLQPDPDGYTIQVDGGPVQVVRSSATLPFDALTPGNHSILLGDLAANCVAQEENPRLTSVEAGLARVLTFDVVCFGAGSVHVRAETQGFGAYPESYLVTLDRTERGTLPVLGGITVTDIPPGAHLLGISGLGENCRVEGENPKEVITVERAGLTMIFKVLCGGPPAALRLQTRFVGWDPVLESCCVAVVDQLLGRSVGYIGAIVWDSLSAGDHIVSLLEVPESCPVRMGPSRSVLLTSGDTTEVSFTFACYRTIGSLQVTVTTSGPLADTDGYLMYGTTGAAFIPSNGTLMLDDIYTSGFPKSLSLTGVNTNCSVTGGKSRDVVIIPQDTVNVTFEVTCSPAGVTQWDPVASGAGGFLTAVHGTSANDMFITSANDQVGSGILHFDGARWSSHFRAGYEQLNGVWAHSPSDVFAAGADRTGSSYSSATVYHYDGAGWAEVTRFESPHGYGSFNALWGTPAGKVFAVGGVQYYLPDDIYIPNKGLIGHYDGMKWLTQEFDHLYFTDVWGLSDREVYAVGSNYAQSRGIVLRYDGISWSNILDTPRGCTAVWASGPQDIYVAQENGPVLHFDGLNWSPAVTPPTTVNRLWGASPDDVYAVGDEGLILHFDGVEWKTQTGVPDATLSGVWGTSADHVFAVGDRGTVLHRRR